MTARPVCRMAPADRFAHVERYLGRPVIVTSSHMRAADGSETTDVGVLISVAMSNSGAGSDFAILRRAGGQPDRAINLATILAVEFADLGPRR